MGGAARRMPVSFCLFGGLFEENSQRDDEDQGDCREEKEQTVGRAFAAFREGFAAFGCRVRGGDVRVV